jgi:hypothetical protein
MVTADAERTSAAAHPYVPWLQRAIRASSLAPWLAGERIHAAARSERDALLAGGAGARLPALLALRNQVAELREWPVDLSTLMRRPFYLGIGLGSWVGAALVDAGIGALLR